MATYVELYELAQSTALRERVAIACLVAAESIRADTSPPPNQEQRLAWARRAFENPLAEAGKMLPVVLAQNKDATKVAIEAATDVAIQTAVDSAVNVFAV
jgi:hypothetical protein